MTLPLPLGPFAAVGFEAGLDFPEKKKLFLSLRDDAHLLSVVNLSHSHLYP